MAILSTSMAVQKIVDLFSWSFSVFRQECGISPIGPGQIIMVYMWFPVICVRDEGDSEVLIG